MGYWAKDGSYVREAGDDTPRMTQGDAWEASQRVSAGLQAWEREEKARKEAERQSRVEYYETNRAIEEKRMQALAHERNQREAVRIIVEQKRQEYNRKSLFRKGIAKLTGKTFAKQYQQIEEYAEQRVDKMSPGYLERFIEQNSEDKGMSR